MLPVSALLVGIAVSPATRLDAGLAVAAAGLAVVGIGGYLRRRAHWALVGALVAFIGLGIIAGRAALYQPGPAPQALLPHPRQTTWVGTAEAGQWLPGQKYAFRLRAEAVAGPGRWQPLQARIHVRLPAAWAPKPGARMLLAGYWVPNHPAQGDPFWQGYRQNLARQQIGGTLYLTERTGRLQTLAEAHAYDLRVLAQQAARASNQLLTQALGNTAAAGTAKALLLGTREGLTDELQATYAACGAIHLLVVSGGHLAFLWAAGYALLLLLPPGWQGRNRWAGRLVLLGLVWAFAFVAGLAPSMLRAAFMLTLAQAGLLWGRPSANLNGLAGAAWVLLVLDPAAAFSLSFQLSFGCVAGILVLGQRLEQAWQPRNTALSWVWKALATTLGAQAGALPFTLVYFGQIPLWFWLANPPAIAGAAALLPATVGLLALQGLAHAVPWAQPLAQGLAWLVTHALNLLNGWMAWVAHLPQAVQEGYFLTAAQAACLALALLWLAKWPARLTLRHARLGVLLAGLWCLGSIVALQRRHQTVRVALVPGPSAPFLAVQQGLHLRSPDFTARVALALRWQAEHWQPDTTTLPLAKAWRINGAWAIAHRRQAPAPLRRQAWAGQNTLIDLSRQPLYELALNR